MTLTGFALKYYYRYNNQVEKLSERDRILAVFIAVVMLFAIWFLVIFTPITKTFFSAKQQTQAALLNTQNLHQKTALIQSRVMMPNLAPLSTRYKNLTTILATLEKQSQSDVQRYMSDRDLNQLIHEIVKQTNGVAIEDFATVVPPISLNTPLPMKPGMQTETNFDATHYRLVLRGPYFPIMHYLDRLEKLSWQLYWEQFVYRVHEHPEGVATLTFYTLQPPQTHIRGSG